MVLSTLRLVRDALGVPAADGQKMARLNPSKAEELKKQAIEELTALGVTFPVNFDFYISGASQTALDSATVLKDVFEQSLGADYVTLNIKTYVSSVNKEVRDPKLQSFLSNGWGADYGDPINYLGQEIYDNDNAWYSNSYSNINDVEETEATKDLIASYKTYTEMVQKADAITTDMDARYKAFAEAEAYMLEEGFVMPNNYGIGWALSKINLGTKANAAYGICNEKWKNVETNKNGYTTEEGMVHQASKLGK